MKSILIFDSLTHPTLDGNWILPKYPRCAEVEHLLSDMEDNNVCSAFAVGMQGIGGYDEVKYIRMIQEYGKGKLFPIAFVSFNGKDKGEIDGELLRIKQLGYVGIKLHPRMGGFMLNDSRLPFVIDKANEYGLVVMLCTYFYSNTQSLACNNVYQLGEMLLNIDASSKLILLHGGVVRLLDVMEIVRAFPNTLLDLSLTMCKYSGSSLDMDIGFLFRQFDRRVCVGTDHPEISHKQLRERFDYFAAGTTVEKAENIAYKNLVSFTGMCTDLM